MSDGLSGTQILEMNADLGAAYLFVKTLIIWLGDLESLKRKRQVVHQWSHKKTKILNVLGHRGS